MFTAEFVKGIVGDDRLLHDNRPQVALVGRSNVGKSSTVNALVGRKSLARASKKPGKTQEINAYSVNKQFYLMDLPGYGFAKGSRDRRSMISDLIQWYLSSVKQIALLIVIIDAKVGPTKDDIATVQYIQNKGVELLVVANKIDKVSSTKIDEQMQHISDTLNAAVLPYSANKGEGISEMREYIMDSVKTFTTVRKQKN